MYIPYNREYKIVLYRFWEKYFSSYTQGRRILKVVLYEFFGQNGVKIQRVFRAKRRQNSTFFCTCAVSQLR